MGQLLNSSFDCQAKGASIGIKADLWRSLSICDGIVPRTNDEMWRGMEEYLKYNGEQMALWISETWM